MEEKNNKEEISKEVLKAGFILFLITSIVLASSLLFILNEQKTKCNPAYEIDGSLIFNHFLLQHRQTDANSFEEFEANHLKFKRIFFTQLQKYENEKIKDKTEELVRCIDELEILKFNGQDQNIIVQQQMECNKISLQLDSLLYEEMLPRYERIVKEIEKGA